MKANLSYPEIVESYQDHLRRHAGTHQSFTHFCERHNVRPLSVSQWLRRRGMTVSSLYYSVILEKVSLDPTYMLPSGSGRKNSSRKEDAKLTDSSVAGQEAHILRGVSIVFPDGTQIGIRQTTAVGVSRLIDLYNKQTMPE
jgi:hypothetical protein